MEQREKYFLTLVHGTIMCNAARLKPASAAWWKPHSIFRDLLTPLLPGVRCAEFNWSGRNGQHDRQQAALALREQLRRQLALHGDAKHVIVAHSHGGNVALYALSDRELQAKIPLVICLNTPFLVPLRRGTGHIMAGPTALLLPLASLIVYPLFHLMLDHGASRSGMIFDAVIALASTLAAAGLFWMYLLTLERLGWLGNVIANRERIVESFKLPELTQTTVACLYSASDEVYDAFVLVEGVGNLPYALLRPRIIFWGIPVLMTAHLLGLLPLVPGYNAVPVIGWLMDKAMQFHAAGDWTAQLPAAFYSSIMYATAYILLMEALAFAFNAFFRFLPLGVKSANLWDKHYVRLATTLIPATKGRVIFEDFDVGASGLAHSAIHKNKEVIRRIATLITAETRPAPPF